MSIEVDPGDWSSLDTWWVVYAQSSPPSILTRLLDSGGVCDHWTHLDSWWRTYTESPAVVRSASGWKFGTEHPSDVWTELDPWWGRYVEKGHETAVELADLLKQSNEEWRTSKAPFDTDPLAADLTLDRRPHGPLQPKNEVSWSRWLSRLLAPSPALITELFGVAVDQHPDEVLREDQLSKEDGTVRRPDILLCYADRGVSIEVKLDDENYTKTAETAKLVEQHYPDRVWTHAILLPERKLGRLESIVEPPVEYSATERPKIQWTEPGPVSVVHWRDVALALRTLLRRGALADDHWAANSYLFCSVVEQQLIRFQPQHSIDRMALPVNVVDTIQPIRLATPLGEQLTYLREDLDV